MNGKVWMVALALACAEEGATEPREPTGGGPQAWFDAEGTQATADEQLIYTDDDAFVWALDPDTAEAGPTEDRSGQVFDVYESFDCTGDVYAAWQAVPTPPPPPMFVVATPELVARAADAPLFDLAEPSAFIGPGASCVAVGKPIVAIRSDGVIEVGPPPSTGLVPPLHLGEL